MIQNFSEEFTSQHFKNVIGVFQGGGVKVISLVGALEACNQANIKFEVVSGTSGGSIVASLLAAGYNASELKNILFGLDFKNFLQSPKSISKLKPLGVLTLAQKIGWNKSLLLKLLNNYGLYNANYISTLINELICEKLGLNKPYATFADLKTPLIVVASNLMTGKPKVWSTFDTPHDSVGKAVMASCSIPFFFQPLVEADGVYVDGGMVSNFPISLTLSKVNKEKRRPVPVLGFSLVEKVENYGDEGPWGLLKYLQKLSNTIVDGNIDLEFQRESKRVFIIPIEVQGINATDFNKMSDPKNKDLLYLAGYNTAQKYILEEDNYIGSKNNLGGDLIHYSEEYLSKMQKIFETSKEQILIVEDNLDWVFKLIISIFYSLSKGVKILLIVNDNLIEKHKHRIGLLRNLGCEIKVAEGPAKQQFIGIISDPSSEQNCKMICKSSSPTSDGIYATYYTWYDSIIINIMYRYILELNGNPSFDSNFIPTLVEDVTSDEIIALLKRNKFYEHKSISISYKKIKWSETKPHIKSISEYKYNQIALLHKIFKEKRLDLYAPVAFKLKNGNRSFVIPPILELKKDRRLHLVEGHTRFFHAYREREDVICGFIIENVSANLPSNTKNWEEVTISYDNEDPYDMFQSNDKELLRFIEGRIRNVEEWL